MARYLFSFRSLWYLKFYEVILRELSRRGHSVHVIVDHGQHNRKAASLVRQMEALTRECDGVSFAWSPKRVGDPWIDLSYWTRRGLDYVRFLEPQFERAPILRERAATRAPRALRAIGENRILRRPPVVRALERILDYVDRVSTGSNEGLDEMFEHLQPDAVMVTPLVTLGSVQFDILRGAQQRRVPTALAVASWDHLSSKALVRTPPDRIFVWNSVQRREATEYHGIPDERIVVTGAQCFDEWFERRPSCDESMFRRRVGLPEGRPLVLYVCSALFEGSPNEAAFVEEWIRAVRQSSDVLLRDAAILVRPHPKRAYEWEGVSLDAYAGVSVWPPLGEAPIRDDARQSYFDCLSHATAIVGLNTSAQIEGGIIGRPIYTVLLPEFWNNQEGTLHFPYLLQVEGGLLHAARSMDEHVRQLAAGLRDPDAAASRNRRFVQAFVRPNGMSNRSTDHFIQAVEALPLVPAAGLDVRTASSFTARMVLRLLARAVRGTAPGTRRLWNDARQHRRRALPPFVWPLRAFTRPLSRVWPRRFGSGRAWREARRRARRTEAVRRGLVDKERLAAKRLAKVEREQRVERERALARESRRRVQRLKTFPWRVARRLRHLVTSGTPPAGT